MNDPRPKWALAVLAAVRSPVWRRLAIGAGTFVALALIVGIQYVTPALPLTEGQVSPRDIEAPRGVDFIDRVTTEARRTRAAQGVDPVYVQSDEVNEQTHRAAEAVFDAIEAARAAPGDPAVRARLLRQAAPFPLDDDVVLAALTLEPQELQTVRTSALQIVDRTMGEGIRSGELAAAQGKARLYVRALSVTGRPMTLISGVATGVLRPNLVVDQAATLILRRRARDAVEPVRARVLRGEVIVRRGEVVTPIHIQKLAAVGLVTEPFSWSRFAGMALLALLLLLVTGAYLRQYQPEIWSRNSLLLLWSLAVVLTAALARLMVSRFNPYLLPSAAGIMVITVLLHPRVALYTAAVLSLLVAVIAGGDTGLGLVTFIGSTVGVYAIKRMHHRTDLIVAGLRVGAANALTVTAIGLVDQLPVYPPILRDAGYGLASGVVVGVIVIGVLPYLEHLFGLVTPIKLLELSSPGHPLLRRLQIEAPGTYHHSIVVANLAESAAEAIGADSLLVRVGAYYHDIGKMRRPVFFVENQAGAENPHEKMAPSLSALTVLAHVRDGVEYAREQRLPEAVIRFIPEHHGTGLVTYFYHQAMSQGDAVGEEVFRYEGPKPQSRESAVLMLADAVEGAVRSMQHPTPDRIGQVVRRIIRERLDDGQLDECDLTFRDLDAIAQTFTRLLASMFHPRVEYPDLERDLQGRRPVRAATQ